MKASDQPLTSKSIDKERQNAIELCRHPEDLFPLSFGQYRLWFLDQLTPGSAAYNITDFARMHGVLNVPAFRHALDAIVARHKVLRTRYVSHDGVPVPVVGTNCAVECKEVDLSVMPATERKLKLDELLKQEAARPFDLSRDIMLRAAFFKLADKEYVFLHNSHHIAWDLRSKFVFYSELSELYGSFCTGSSARLPELPIQYYDYAFWERQRIQGGLVESLVSYWKQQLSGAALKLELPTDYARPRILTYRGGPRVPIVLDAALLSAVEAFVPPVRLGLSKALLWRGISPFHTLLAAFNVLMYAYSGQEDILVSSPYSNRDHPELMDLIGFFPNTMILRACLSGNLTFGELAVRVLDTVQSAVLHAALPLDRIVALLKPVRRPGRLPLVQVNFRIQKTPVPELKLHGLSVDLPDWVDTGGSKFDLALELVTTPRLRGYFEYSADLFRPSTVAQMAMYYEKLLRELLQHTDVAIEELHTFREIRQELKNALSVERNQRDGSSNGPR